MIFVNEKELAKHKALIHTTNNEKMSQYQSCHRFLIAKDFKKY
jgi:hypothetical protein